MVLDSSIISKTIYIITSDNNEAIHLKELLTDDGFKLKFFLSYDAYIEQVDETQGCLIADIEIDNKNGTDLLNRLNAIELLSPVVFIANMKSVDTMVEVIKLGAFDFIEKPLNKNIVLQKITHAVTDFQKNIEIISRYKSLTEKEKKVFACIVLGATNQQMTEKLYISTSTVEKHRAAVMKKMQADTLPCLVKMLPLLKPLSIDLEPNWCNLSFA